MARHRDKLEDKFWRKVVKGKDENDCWEWNASKFKQGYGQITHGEEMHEHKNLKAHRVSYEIHFGSIPENMLVCHICDNRSCSNPKHLFLGSCKDNVNDMIIKGRRRDTKGEKNGLNKITEIQVREIREKYNSNKVKEKYLEKEFSTFKLSQEYGISQSIISSIINYKRWKHVE